MDLKHKANPKKNLPDCSKDPQGNKDNNIPIFLINKNEAPLQFLLNFRVIIKYLFILHILLINKFRFLFLQTLLSLNEPIPLLDRFKTMDTFL